MRAALPFIRRKLPEGDAAFEERLVWILGSPRTGSSWLLRLLVHPLRTARTPIGLSAPSSVRRDDRPSIVAINESHVCQHLTPMTRDLPRYAGADHEDHSAFLLNRGLRDHPSYLFADEYAEAWRPKARELVLARLRAQAEAGARQLDLRDPLVVIKEPQSHGADFLMSLLPGSRLVFLVRDGREVVRSLLALYGPGGRLAQAPTAPTHGSDDSRLRFVRNQSRRWLQRMQSVRAAFDSHAPDRRLLVRYEDLIAATPSELRRLTGWMGLARTEEQIQAAIEAESQRTRPTGSGRREADVDEPRDPRVWELNASEREVADEVMAPMLRELGYPL